LFMASLPLHVMVAAFKSELGASGSTTVEVVHNACDLVGIPRSGAPRIIELASAVYTSLYGSGDRGASRPSTAAVVAPVGEDEMLAAALEASMHVMPAIARMPSAGGAVGSAGREMLECSICFDNLAEEDCAVFLRGTGKRACSHALHHRCALELPQKTCPLCRAPFESVKRLPVLNDDPGAWFKCIDVEGDGKLSQPQVLQALLTQFPLDVSQTEAELKGVWPTLQLDASERVGYAEFIAPGGLLEYVRGNLPNMQAGGRLPGTNAASGGGGGGGGGAGAIPDIKDDPDAWFTYYDEDGTGTLSQEQVVRGLIKTFQLSADLAQVQRQRTLVAAVWQVFAEGDGVSRHAFQRADGLAEAIVASCQAEVGTYRAEQQRRRSGRPAAPAARAAAAAPPPSRGVEEEVLVLPDNIKPCPACGMLLEKISGDDTMMCGCEGRPAGGTLEKALAAGGCGHEFNFASLAPLGCGRPGAPANERQTRFRRRP